MQRTPTSFLLNVSLHFRGRGVPNCAAEDVNADGLADLVCHFETQLTGLVAGMTEAVLKGETVDGMSVEGRDAVQVRQRSDAAAVRIRVSGVRVLCR